MRGNLGAPMRDHLALLFIAITTPLVVLGSYSATSTFHNNLMEWPAADSHVRADYEVFRNRFDPNDVAMVSWLDCTLFNSDLANAHAAIAGDAEGFFSDVWSGISVYDTLRNDIGHSHETCLDRIRGSLLAPTGERSCVVVALSEKGSKNRTAAFARLKEILEKCGLDPGSIKMGGPAHDLYQIDYEGFWSPLRAVPLIGLLAFFLAWLSVRRFQLAAVISLLGFYTGQLALTVVYLSGTHLNVLVWTMPTLVLLLTMSASLHFLGYYREAIQHDSPEPPYRLAVRTAWKPICYCALTTSAGLFSLLLSDTRPVREFGLYGGISVLASCIVVLTCLPSWLRAHPWKPRPFVAQASSVFSWRRLADTTKRFRYFIILVALVAMPGLTFAIPRLVTGVNIQNLFSESSQVVRDAKWFEENVCPLSSIELLLTFENANPRHDASRLKYLQFLEKTFRSEFEIPGVLSPATYAPRWVKQRSGMRGLVDRRVMENRIERIREASLESGLLSHQDDSETWRMSLRVSNVQETDIIRLIEDLERVVIESFEKNKAKRFPGEELNLLCTGQSRIFRFIEKQFLSDLTVTYGTAFLLISVVILFVMRSIVGVLLVSPPNILPAVVVLGGTSLAGVSLDVGSLMTASIALGIAVDDTLHFVLWWRDKIRGGMDSHEALVHAMQHCGLAMVQTTIVCGVSVALYAFCGFLPTVRFGLLLSGMLFAAIIGDLILLPAILSTRLGRSSIARPEKSTPLT